MENEVGRWVYLDNFLLASAIAATEPQPETAAEWFEGTIESGTVTSHITGFPRSHGTSVIECHNISISLIPYPFSYNFCLFHVTDMFIIENLFHVHALPLVYNLYLFSTCCCPIVLCILICTMELTINAILHYF